MALPGQSFINGVSNLVFGTNMPPDFVPQTVRNTPQIQARIKAGGFTLMRVAFASTDSDSFIDSKIDACVACGCAVLAILTRSSSSFNQHLVSYLGNRCNLYEFTNEPDLNGWDVATYISNWNSQIPTLRGLNPNAAFIGPALGVVANFESYLRPFLQACVTSGVIPDAVSFHSYPCTNTAEAAACAPRAVNIGANDVTACRNIIQSVFGFHIPIGVTEWNIDASNPPKAYTQDAQFNATWTKSCLKSMVDNGAEIACQFDAASGAGGGLLDLINTVAPYSARVQYAPMVESIQTYLNPSTGGGSPRLVGPDTAIGFCIGQPNNDNINPLLVTHCADTGVKWLRWQPYWKNIEPVRNGGFHFGNLDSVVKTCNANGINITITAMLGFSLPSWQSSAPAPASDYLRYARAIADRYNGNNGVGIIQGIEIGNEDFDQGANKPYQPLATVMNTVYPPIKSAYPDLLIGPACSLQRNASHIDSWWRGMWRDASGHFDYINTHYYTGIPGGSLFSYDPSVTKGTVPSFPAHLQILRNAASDAGHANFPIWLTETGFAVNNFDAYQCGSTVTTQATQRDFLKYELDQLQAIDQPAKCFIFTMTYKSRAGSPQCGVGTTQGMSLFQTSPSGNFTTLAYSMVKSYPKDWGGGSSIGTAQRDVTARARVRTGAATTLRDLGCRARTKVFDGTIKDVDLSARARFVGGIYDSFARPNQTTWGTASNGEAWAQAGGNETPTIVNNRGRITGGLGTNTMRLGSQSLADVDASVRVRVSRASDIVGVTLRDNGLNDFIRLRLTATQLQIVAQTPGGGFVILTSYAFAVAANVDYRLRFRVLGSDLRGKIWEDGDPEPDWLLSANSTLVSLPGQCGLSVALNNAIDIAEFDDFNALEAAQFALPPQPSVRDLAAYCGVVIPTFDVKADLACRVRIFDPEQITVLVFAAKRPPLQRRFPKS